MAAGVHMPLVGSRVEQGIKLAGVGNLQLDEPARAKRVGVDLQPATMQPTLNWSGYSAHGLAGQWPAASLHGHLQAHAPHPPSHRPWRGHQQLRRWSPPPRR